MTSISNPAEPDTATDELPEDIVAAAHWWRDWGLAVAPMDPDKKHTRIKWTSWLWRLETEGHAAIDAEFRQRDHLCAIVDDRVFVLDADTPKSAAALYEIEAAHDVRPNLIVQTKNGAHHWFRRAPGTYAKAQGYSSEKHPDRVDIRTARGANEGLSVIVLPPTPGKVIEINEADTVDDLVEVDQSFIDAIFTHNGQEAPRPPESRQEAESRRKLGTTEAAEILSYIPPECGYSDWLDVLMGAHDKFDGNDDGLLLVDSWSAGADKYCGSEELEYKYQSFTPGGGVTWASVCKLAQDHGADLSVITRRYDADGNRLPTFEEAHDAAQALDRESDAAAIEEAATMARGLSAIQRRQVLDTIKRGTGTPLGDLRQYLAETHDTENTPPLEYAKRALAEYGDGDIVYAEGTFWTYPGNGVWSEEHAEGVKKKIIDVMPEDAVTGNAVDGTYKLTRTVAYEPGARFGDPFEGVNVRNGLLVHDGQQWELQPHDRDLYLLAQIPVEHDPEATCPRFNQFLREVFEGDPDAEEKALLLWQLVGYTLLPTTRFEKFVILVGNGANGKSVLLEVLAALLGNDSVAGVAPDKLDNAFQRAYLHGKLANIVTEIAQGAIINDSALKAITSGELSTAEHKYRSPFTFRPYATCWFATNHMPHTRDFSDALFRRACLLTFNQTFKGERCDPRLKDTLLEELPGILNAALNAIGDVLMGGSFAEPASMMEARHEWRLEADQALQFIEECCHMGDGEIEKSQLYLRYKLWADVAGINRVLTKKSFTNRLKQAGIGERRTNAARFYVGISLNQGV